MRIVTIDCSTIADRDGFHTAMEEALGFPSWYGRSLDALHDCLTEVFDNTQLILRNWCFLEEILGAYAAAIRRSMTHAEKENPCIEIYFD